MSAAVTVQTEYGQGRVGHLIRSRDATQVQREIDRIMRCAELDPVDVAARASGPHRDMQGHWGVVEVRRLRQVDHEPFRMFLGSLRGAR